MAVTPEAIEESQARASRRGEKDARGGGAAAGRSTRDAIEALSSGAGCGALGPASQQQPSPGARPQQQVRATLFEAHVVLAEAASRRPERRSTKASTAVTTCVIRGVILIQKNASRKHFHAAACVGTLDAMDAEARRARTCAATIPNSTAASRR